MTGCVACDLLYIFFWGGGGVSRRGQLKHLRLLASSNFEPVILHCTLCVDMLCATRMGGAEEVGGVTWFALGCRKPSVNIGWAFLLLFLHKQA